MRFRAPILLSIATVCAVLCCASLTAVSAEGGTPETIQVVTYNVQFLPGIAAIANERKEPDYRAARIADEMSHFDIVALQEVFDDRHREQIVQGIRKAWGGRLNLFASPKDEGRSINGGCLLLTRMPILETHAHIFKHFSTPEKYGVTADGHAAKGVIHARIARDKSHPDNFIDVFVTHLEARADELRPLQYVEFAAFVKERSDPQHPVLLLGDFNTKGMPEHWDNPDSQYSVFMRTLNAARTPGGFTDVWPLLKGRALGGTTDQESFDIGKRIDYIMIGNPTLPASGLRPLSIRVGLYQDERVVALSDHNAVIAEFEWPTN